MLAALFSHAVSTMMALPASKAAEVHTELPEEQVGSRVGEMWCAAPPIKVALPSIHTTSQQPTGSRRKPVYTSCTTCHLSQRERLCGGHVLDVACAMTAQQGVESAPIRTPQKE